MRIAIINTVCQYGSTGRLAYGVYKTALDMGHECKLYYGRGEASSESGLVKFDSDLEVNLHAAITRLTGGQGRHSTKGTQLLIDYLEKFNADTIILMNLHGYYLNLPVLYDYLSHKDTPIIQMMYDEYSYTGRCPFAYDCNKFKNKCFGNTCKKEYPQSWFFSDAAGMWNIKANFYSKVRNILFLGAPYVAHRAKESTLLKGKKIEEFDEGDDIVNTFFPHDVTDLRKKLSIPNDNKVVLNVAPFSAPRKGVKYYFEGAKKLQDRKDITFIHVGFDGKPDECPSNVIPIGYIRDLKQLSDYYCLADLFVCTSFADTVPNTCIEALGCGVKICGFDISGIPYSACSPYGVYVKAGDVDALVTEISQIKKKSVQSINETRAYAMSRFDQEEYSKRLIQRAILLRSECGL